MTATTLAPTRGDMTNDSKPSRFSMIAEELTYDPKPRATDVRPGDAPVVRRTASGLECPRCGCGAFEPVAGAYALCLGCPPPAPSYPVPVGARLDTARYRCNRCGKQRQVTCALSDVNLHCDGCGGRLALHARQDPPKASVSGRALVLGRAATRDDPETATALAWTQLLDTKKGTIAELAAAFNAELTGVLASRGVTPPYYQRTRDDIAFSDVVIDMQRATSSSNNYGMANFDNQILARWVPSPLEDAYSFRTLQDAAARAVAVLSADPANRELVSRLSELSSGPTWEGIGAEVTDEAARRMGIESANAVEVEQLARALAAELGLDDFEEYALRQAEKNRRRGVPAARQTGRTWCGLLRALARCRLERAEVLSVHGGPRANTEDLKMVAIRLAKRIDDRGTSKYPSRITTLKRPDLAERKGADERGLRTVVYRDHYQGKGPR